MKKLLLSIVVAAVFCSVTFAQQDIWTDTLDLSEIVGTDTVLFRGDSLDRSDFGGMWSLEVEYSGLDDDDATFSIGGSVQGFGFNAIDDDDIPFTLDVTTNTAEVNGTNRTTKLFYGFYWPFITTAYKVDPGSVTSGSIILKFVQTY